MGDVGDEKWVVDWRAVKSPPCLAMCGSGGPVGFWLYQVCAAPSTLIIAPVT